MTTVMMQTTTMLKEGLLMMQLKNLMMTGHMSFTSSSIAGGPWTLTGTP